MYLSRVTRRDTPAESFATLLVVCKWGGGENQKKPGKRRGGQACIYIIAAAMHGVLVVMLAIGT